MPDTLIARGPVTTADIPVQWDGALSSLEAKADTDSLEALHQRRRELIDANAPLIARYGSFGLHDDYRKSFVECEKLRARRDLAERGVKATEGMVDAEAYGSDAYAKFLDNALAEKIEYLRAQNEIDEINEKIRSRELAILAFNAEARLAR